MRLSAFLSLPIFVSCYEYVTSPAPFYCYAGDSAYSPEEVVCPARSCVTRLLPREDNKFAVELDCNPEGSVCHNFEDGTQISVCCVASRCNNAHAVVFKEEEKMNISHAAWLLAVEAEKLKLNRTDRLPNPLPNVGAGPEDDTTEAPEGRPRRGAGRPMAALFVTLHMVQYSSLFDNEYLT